jgi:hypothetical protein
MLALSWEGPVLYCERFISTQGQPRNGHSSLSTSEAGTLNVDLSMSTKISAPCPRAGVFGDSFRGLIAPWLELRAKAFNNSSNYFTLFLGLLQNMQIMTNLNIINDQHMYKNDQITNNVNKINNWLLYKHWQYI